MWIWKAASCFLFFWKLDTLQVHTHHHHHHLWLCLSEDLCQAEDCPGVLYIDLLVMVTKIWMRATGFQLCGYVWMLFLFLFLRFYFLNAGDKNVCYCLFVHFKPATNERPVQHARSCSGCTTCAQTRACDSAARQGSRGQGHVQRKGDHCGCICYVSFANLSLLWGCLRDGKGLE